MASLKIWLADTHTGGAGWYDLYQVRRNTHSVSERVVGIWRKAVCMSSDRVNFQTTHWTLIGKLDGPQADSALAQLCEQYWQPLYAFVRQRTSDVHQAQDLTQGFFEHLLSHNSMRLADRDQGRFRTFLLAAFKNYMSNEHSRQTAARRGGGRTPLSLDFEDAEQCFQRSRVSDASPDQQFERAWTLQLIDRVTTLLENEFQEKGQAEKFEVLKPALTFANDAQTQAAIASRLGQTPAAVRQTVSRLRRRFRDLLHAEVTRLVHDSNDVEDEIRQMFRSLSG